MEEYVLFICSVSVYTISVENVVGDDTGDTESSVFEPV